MILVTGATGTTGREVVRQLVEAGEPVRLLVRNPEKADVMRDAGYEVAEGDMLHPETLLPAMEDVSRVFLVSSPAPDQVQLQSNLIQAARTAGVRHLVKLSVWGAALDAPSMMSRWHGQSEAEVKASGLAWTMLQPGAFMQNFLMFMSSIAIQGTFCAPMGDAAVSMVDARDIASVAVRTLIGPGHEGQSYVITGPEALTYHQAAAHFSALLGRPIAFVDEPLEVAHDNMLDAGMPAWFAEAYCEIYGVLRSGRAAVVSPVVRDLTGREGTTFASFLADHAALFRLEAPTYV